MGIQNREGALYWATGIDNSGLKKGKAESVGIIKGLMKQVSGVDVFAGIGVSAALAFAKITKEAYNFSKEFQTAMKEVQTISRATQDNYEGMSAAIVKMSREVPDSAAELSKAFYEIVSAGYDGAEGLRILEAASRGAVAGVTTTTIAADGLTTILNAWKLETSEVNKVNDIMFRTVELGKVTYDELAGSIAQVAPLAAASGISFEEIGAAISTLTKQGTPAAQAITQIRSAMIAMNEQLGEGWGNSKSLQEGFEALAEISKTTGKQLNEVTGRVEGAMAVLATTGKNAQGAAEDIRSIGEAAGSTEKAFAIMVESADTQLKILSNNIKERMKEYGDYLVIATGNIAGRVNEKMRENAEARDKAIVAGIKREITIIESELKTLDNPIDSFFFGKENLEEKRKILQEQLKTLTGDIKAAQEEIDGITAKSENPETKLSYVDPVEFKKSLDLAQRNYEEYEMLVTNGFKKEAEAFYWTQLEAGKNYKKYLQEQLKTYEHDMEARKIIYLELSKIILQETEEQKKAEEAAFILQSKRLEALKKLTESINNTSATRIIPKSQTDGDKNQDAITREMFGKITKGLTVVNEIQSKSERIQNQWDNIIEDISNPDAWSVGADAVREIGFVISQTNREVGEMVLGLGDTMNVISTALTKGASDGAIMVSVISMISNSIARYASGQYVQGEKYLELMDGFNKKMEEFNRLLSIADRKGGADAIYDQELKELTKQKEFIESTIKLKEKQYRTMGLADQIVYGNKAKKEIQQYKDDLEEINRLIEDTSQQWTDFTAGLITELDLANQIARAFQEGKTSAADFAEYTNEIMRDAVLEAFKASILGPELTKIQEYIALALSDERLDGREQARIDAMMNEAVENSEQKWKDYGLDKYFGKTGNNEDPNSLSGSIRASLTEETGSILAGTLNAMRLDVREIVNLQLSAVDYLMQITTNTDQLHSINANLDSLKNSFQNIGKS